MTISRPCYASRETVKRALDYKETARSDGQVDRAIEAASDDIDGGTERIGGLLQRRFYPVAATRTFDWPGEQYARPWRLWLDQHELIEATTITAAGVALAPGDYFLRPDSGPPFNRVEINIGSAGAFNAGDTWQRAIAITGLFGYSANESPAGALVAGVNANAVGVDLDDGSRVGVGDLIRIGDERLLVTGRTMLTTGHTLAGDLTDSDAATLVPAAAGTASVDEVILIDGERMLVIDVAGNNLVVKRAWDGSVLASHTTGASIYAARSLIVERGVLGTTAAAHDSGTAVARHAPPALVRDLCVGIALDQMEQEPAAYARAGQVQDNSHNSISVSNIRSSKNQIGLGLDSLRARAVTAYGRKARTRAV